MSGAICWLLRELPEGNVCVGCAIYWPLRELSGENVEGGHLLADEGTTWCRSPPQSPRSSGSPVGSCPSRASSWVQAPSPAENNRAEEKWGERGSRQWACPQPERCSAPRTPGLSRCSFEASPPYTGQVPAALRGGGLLPVPTERRGSRAAECK